MRDSLLYLSVLFALSCAQQSNPTGGEKDMVPPKIVESMPENFQLKFSGSSIELKFNEFVQINSLKEQLIITPSLKIQPEFVLKGKKLKITFKDSLKPNTTYQFNFGVGIKDITEGNPLDSNLFVFSTGSYIDSLSIKGQIKDAFTLAAVENALVMLYDSGDDSIPFKEKPTYFSRTDKLGNFEIGYLPKGEFSLVAIQDENANYLFDPESETVGFKGELASTEDSIPLIVYLFKEIYSNQYVKSVSSNEYGKILFEFNQPTVKAQANLIGKSFKKQWYISDINSTKDSLIYWITEPVDTLSFKVSDNGNVIDTVDVIMMKKLKEKKWEEKRLSIKVNSKRKGGLGLYDSLKIVSEHPILGYDEKKIILVENGKDTIRVKLQSKDVALRRYYLPHLWKEGAKYNLTILPGAFVDVFDLKNDTIKSSWEAPTKNKYADVNLKIELPQSCKQGIIELNQQGKVIQSNVITSSQTVAYKHLKPGKYGVKMIYDDNLNGKWDTGNLLAKQQPEKVIFYAGVIEVRSGWDVDTVWKIEN